MRNISGNTVQNQHQHNLLEPEEYSVNIAFSGSDNGIYGVMALITNYTQNITKIGQNVHENSAKQCQERCHHIAPHDETEPKRIMINIPRNKERHVTSLHPTLSNNDLMSVEPMDVTQSTLNSSKPSSKLHPKNTDSWLCSAENAMRFSVDWFLLMIRFIHGKLNILSPFNMESVFVLLSAFVMYFPVTFAYEIAQELIADDFADGDLFGYSVSIYDRYIVVGAPSDDSAYIFEKHPETGVCSQIMKLTANDGMPYDYFGNSVSIYDRYAVISSIYNDDTGSAYVFVKDEQNDNWNQTAKLLPSDGGVYNEFGYSLSIYDQYIAIGRYYGSTVYIFKKQSETEWIETKISKTSGFGTSVSLYEGYLLIGSPEENENTGSAYIYELVLDNETNHWEQRAKFVGEASGDWFGRSVAIHDIYALIGSESASAYVFERDEETNNWLQIVKLAASDAQTGVNSGYGTSVTINDEHIVIGAYRDNSAKGSIYIYPIGTWIETKLVAPDNENNDGFGYSVSIFNEYVVSGTERRNSAFVEVLPTPAPTTTPTTATPTTATTSPTTSAPTSSTVSPSTAPTIAPTSTPTIAPTVAPTTAPSTAPTVSPTATPSAAPTEPTLNPTAHPSAAPSLSPTKIPTSAPTVAPSLSPTTNPTYPPSSAPTLSPISSKDYDAYVFIKYLLDNLKTEDTQAFITDTVETLTNIESIIKNKYFDALLLSYHQFMVNIETMDDVDIEDIDDNTRINWMNSNSLVLGTKIECNKYPINYCEAVKQKSQTQNTFAEDVTDELSSYFNGNTALMFSVVEPESLDIICKNCAEPDDIDYVFYGLTAVCGVFVLIAICALLFNKEKFPKLPGFQVVDDGKWAAVVIFALQFWDFSSDVNLSAELWSRDDIHQNVLVLASALGSTVFTLLPYVANLVIAAKIKNIMRDKFPSNETAKSWFQSNTALFTLLVVFTGGAYPALAVVSSNVFGLNVLSCGLTSYELRQMSKIKVFGTVFLENVPQLIFQALYSYAVGSISKSVQVAFFTSVLSVTASTLGYLIDRDTYGIQVVQYCLSTQCKALRSAKNAVVKEESECIDAFEGKTNTITTNKASSQTLMPFHQISDDEKKLFGSNKGRTKALGDAIAQLFETPPKNIEVGHSVMTFYGVNTHIVHYISQIELDDFDQLKNDGAVVSAPYYAQQMHLAMKEQITAVFIKHFGINDDFEVKYMKGLSGSSDKVRRISQRQTDQVRGVLKKVVMSDEISELLRKKGYHPTRDNIGEIVKILSDNEERFNNKITDGNSVSLSLSLNDKADGKQVEMTDIINDDGFDETDVNEDVPIKQYMD